MRAMDDTDDNRNALAIESLAELAEATITSVPEADRTAWIDHAVRARRVALELRAGLRHPPPPMGGRSWSRN